MITLMLSKNKYTDLYFRRQFLLTRVPQDILPSWKKLTVRSFFFYVHPDLEVCQITRSNRSIVLLGGLFDAASPTKSNVDILEDLLTGSSSASDLLALCSRYSGRYALLYDAAAETILFNDALASREIYYCTDENQIVCGSQPNLVAMFAEPQIEARNDPTFLTFYRQHSRNNRWDPTYKWIGDETFYDGIRHLLPNHYLDINSRLVYRYWPQNAPVHLSLSEAVHHACSFLQGSINAITYRYPVMMAVTAGTDSRTLLAASREKSSQIYYYVNDHGLGDHHPDIAVPRAIFKEVNLPFHVHQVAEEVDSEFRTIFLNNTFFASDRIMATIFNIYFKNHTTKVNMLGIGEIGRCRFGREPKHLNGFRLAYKLGYRNDRYAIDQGEKILAEIRPVGHSFGINVLTLFYWEHMLGNWGATGNSESDIAIEEYNPYNCHYLYTLLLGVDEQFAQYDNPILFKEMIHAMWPELLTWPINPPSSLKSYRRSMLLKAGVFTWLKEAKYQFYFTLFRLKSKMALPVPDQKVS